MNNINTTITRFIKKTNFKIRKRIMLPAMLAIALELQQEIYATQNSDIARIRLNIRNGLQYGAPNISGYNISDSNT